MCKISHNKVILKMKMASWSKCHLKRDVRSFAMKIKDALTVASTPAKPGIAAMSGAATRSSAATTAVSDAFSMINWRSGRPSAQTARLKWLAALGSAA